jgi:hypothetical protein
VYQAAARHLKYPGQDNVNLPSLMSRYRKYFIAAVRLHFPDHFENIIKDNETNYLTISKNTQFAKSSSNPIDKRLDFCAYFLALIISLDKLGLPYEQIRQICLEITTDYVRPKNKFQEAVKRLPAKLANTWFSSLLLKWLNKRVSRNSNPDGFLANIITDKNETYGFGYGIDITQCGICKLFNKHNYGKYSSILCEVDELTSALAGLKLIRSGTIALGAKKCDFRFKKANE